MDEIEVKITLVPGELIGEENDMFRVTCGCMSHDCEYMEEGWGESLQEAIKDFDKNNQL